MSNAQKNNVIKMGDYTSTPLSNKSDDELMRLASANYKAAFSELVERYQGRIRGYCNSWSSVGDDLAQEVFVRLWKARSAYAPRGEFRAYLYMIAANVCRNSKRSDARRPQVEPLFPEELTSSSESQLDEILKQERQREIAREISQLSPKLREAVLLRYRQDLSYQEIAAITGRKQETIRSRVLLGIQKIKAAIK